MRALTAAGREFVEIARAMVLPPRCLILDEPTAGFDPHARREFHDVVHRLSDFESTTVLLTTHDLDDIEELCRRIMIIDHGRLLYDGPLGLLKQKLLRTNGFSTFEDYYAFLQRDGSGQALSDLINLISTNYTYFNREKDHFDFFYQTALPTVVKRLSQQNRKDLRIWCAGCST